MAGKGKIVRGALEAITDVASFSDAKQKRDFGALPEGIKHESALSLQKPLITKDRNINELAADIIKRGIGRSEGGLTVNTPNEKAVLELILELAEIRGPILDKVLSSPSEGISPEMQLSIERMRELTKKIHSFDESDKIIDE